MARLHIRLKSLLEKVPDCVWPHLTGRPLDSAAETEAEFQSIGGQTLDAVERIVELRQAQHEHRLNAVEGKSIALLALTSVLVVAMTVLVTMAFRIDTDQTSLTPVQWTGIAIMFYIAANLLNALRATILSMERRNYRRLTSEAILPQKLENEVLYRRRLTEMTLRLTDYNERILNDKVSHLAVAHRALRNTVVAAGLLLIMSFGALLW
jgi:hypothetical protein